MTIGSRTILIFVLGSRAVLLLLAFSPAVDRPLHTSFNTGKVPSPVLPLSSLGEHKVLGNESVHCQWTGPGISVVEKQGTRTERGQKAKLLQLKNLENIACAVSMKFASDRRGMISHTPFKSCMTSQ